MILAMTRSLGERGGHGWDSPSPGRGPRLLLYAKNPALTRLGFCVLGLGYLSIVA